jgi:hypothetical protein
MALDVAVSELASVDFVQVGEVILAETFEDAQDKISFVVAAVVPLKSPLALLFTLVELTNIFSLATVPDLSALAVLLIVRPVAFVPGVVGIDENTVPIGFIVHPFALVDIAIRVCHSALSSGFVFLPHSLILGTVGPEQYTETVSLSCFFVPFTFVELAITHFFELINVNSVDCLVLHLLQVLLGQLERR